VRWCALEYATRRGVRARSLRSAAFSQDDTGFMYYCDRQISKR
jgi:hypothetical protein